MIESSTISLRPLETQHLERTRAWVNHPEIARLLDRANPVSDVEHERWFASIPGRVDCLYFAIETKDGEHIGNIWLSRIDHRHRKAELRVMIGDLERVNRGLGTEAIQLLTAYAFEKLNLHKVYAFVLGINPRARKSFEKAGFDLEGTLKRDRFADGRYIDVYLLGIIRQHSVAEQQGAELAGCKN